MEGPVGDEEEADANTTNPVTWALSFGLLAIALCLAMVGLGSPNWSVISMPRQGNHTQETAVVSGGEVGLFKDKNAVVCLGSDVDFKLTSLRGLMLSGVIMNTISTMLALAVRYITPARAKYGRALSAVFCIVTVCLYAAAIVCYAQWMDGPCVLGSSYWLVVCGWCFAIISLLTLAVTVV